jgi:DNA (cytosine-5)-methyltransferase 1
VRDTIADLRPLDSGEQDPDDEFHRARKHTRLALKRLAHIPEGGGRMDLPDDLVLECHRNHNGHYDIYGRMWWDRVAPTLTSGCTNVTRGRFAHPEQDRAITLREAMLLQSFPAYARLQGGVEKMALQVGNAVPTLVTEQIGKTIKAMERRSRRRR